MVIVDNLNKEYREVCLKRIGLELELYHAMFPSEVFVTPDIIISENFRDDVLNVYRSYDYPEEYLSGLEQRASWDSTAALTINNKKMGLYPTIVVNERHWRDDTLLHELTHVSDYYNYCQKHNYTQLSFLEFLETENFLCVYLLSEFRAFYRGAINSKEDLEKRLEYETKRFQKRQIEIISSQQLETYYYHLVSYVSFYCAYLEKNCSEEEISEILKQEDSNLIHTLFKFLYPLRNKSFDELERSFDDFQFIIESFVSN